MNQILRCRRLYLDMILPTGGMRHWSAQPSSGGPTLAGSEEQSSADIEMTAYVLLAYITKGLASDVVPQAMPIVKWLSKQRNAYGGFSSTQVGVVLCSLVYYIYVTFSNKMSRMSKRKRNYFHWKEYIMLFKGVAIMDLSHAQPKLLDAEHNMPGVESFKRRKTRSKFAVTLAHN